MSRLVAPSRLCLAKNFRRVLEGLDRLGVVRIGVEEVAAVLEEAGILDVLHLDLTADVLGALTPLELEHDLVAVLLDEVLGNAVARVLNVDLDDDGAVPVVVAAEQLDAAIHLR